MRTAGQTRPVVASGVTTDVSPRGGVRENMPDVERLVYTIPEAAAALRISRTKLYELLAANEIESFQIGRTRKIPVEAVRDYLRRQRKEDSAA